MPNTVAIFSSEIRGPTVRVSADRSEKCVNFLRQFLRLLQGGKMSTSLHLRPAGDVPIHALCERPWRPQEILRKLGVTARDMDALARRYHPWPVEPRIVRPEARSDRTRRP